MKKEVFKIRIDKELNELFLEYLEKVPLYSRNYGKSFATAYEKMTLLGYKKTISEDIKTVKANPHKCFIEDVDDLREIRVKFAKYGKKYFTLDYDALQTETKTVYLTADTKKRIRKIMEYLMTRYKIAVNEATIMRGAIFSGGLGVYEEEFGLKENIEPTD